MARQFIANTRLEEAIIQAYEIIGRETPLKADCGQLCGAACCKDYDEREEYAGRREAPTPAAADAAPTP